MDNNNNIIITTHKSYKELGIFKSSPWVFELFTFIQNYKKAKLK